MVVDYFINSFFGCDILLMLCFNKHISYILALDRHFSYLDLCSTFILKSSNCLTTFTDDETNCVVRNWNDISVRRRSTIRSHHAFI
jgi:hypothetical protein